MTTHTDPTMTAMAQFENDLGTIDPNLPADERRALVAQAKARAKQRKTEMEAEIKAAKDAKIAEIRLLRAAHQQLDLSAHTAQTLLDGLPDDLKAQAAEVIAIIEEHMAHIAGNLADLGAGERAQ